MAAQAWLKNAIKEPYVQFLYFLSHSKISCIVFNFPQMYSSLSNIQSLIELKVPANVFIYIHTLAVLWYLIY